MNRNTYYLSSLDYFSFEQVRECQFTKQMVFDTGKECALVKLSPPVIGQPWGLIGDIEFFVLANRHVGETLFPIKYFPCFVHIARILKEEISLKDVISKSDLEMVGWGELYETRHNAENHIFQ